MIFFLFNLQSACCEVITYGAQIGAKHRVVFPLSSSVAGGGGSGVPVTPLPF